jgi:diguanylate cyclase (GGDEF)-like protein
VASILRLLIIDDSEGDAALIVRALSKAGYDVRHERVETRDALVSALDRGPWDLVIGEYGLPRLSGTTALHLVRDRDFDVPLVFVSSTAGEDAAVAAMKAGAHDYFRKGNLKRLIPAVRHELRQAAARRKRRRVALRLAHLAYHDHLTDLPNRVLLHDRLAQAVRTANRDRKPFALLVIDLDGFKQINDMYGHRAGDRVLQHIADRVRTTVREADTVARLGGDEFAVVLPSADVNGARQAARKVLREIQRPCVVDHRSLSVHGSIGIACFPEHGRSADTLLQKADVAMYLAKSDRSEIAAYSPKIEAEPPRRAADAKRRRG